MITIKRYKKDIKLYVRDSFWYSCKYLVIFGVVLLAFAIYFVLAAIISNFDKKAFQSAIRVSICAAILLLLCLRMYFHYKKVISLLFKNSDENGVILEKLYLEDEYFVIENVTL